MAVIREFSELVGEETGEGRKELNSKSDEQYQPAETPAYFVCPVSEKENFLARYYACSIFYYRYRL